MQGFVGAFFLRESNAKLSRKTRKESKSRKQTKIAKKLFAFRELDPGRKWFMRSLLNACTFFATFAEFSRYFSFAYFVLFSCRFRVGNTLQRSQAYTHETEESKPLTSQPANNNTHDRRVRRNNYWSRSRRTLLCGKSCRASRLHFRKDESAWKKTAPFRFGTVQYHACRKHERLCGTFRRRIACRFLKAGASGTFQY